MNILQECRKRIGLTQRQMAHKLKLSIDAIRSYEQKNRAIKPCDIIRVAEAYSMTDREIVKYLKEISK